MDHLASSINLVIDVLIVIHLIEHLDCCLSLSKLCRYIALQPASSILGKKYCQSTYIIIFFFSLARYFHVSDVRERFEKRKVPLKFVCLYMFAAIWGKKRILIKNEGIMILASAPFLPARVCEVFISVIVIHPSSVHSELITAYEK